jgi:hypothetical protein
MPPVLGAGVTVENALVVAHGEEGHGRCAIAQGKHGQFRPAQPLFDDDGLGSGVAQQLIDHVAVQRRLGLCLAVAHRDAQPHLAQPADLDDETAVFPRIQVGQRRVVAVEGGEGGRGDVVPLHKFFGKRLGIFQPRGRLPRAKDGQPGGLESIHHAQCQGIVGAHHGQVDLVLPGRRRAARPRLHR